MIEEIKDTIRQHLFETTDTVSQILQDKYGIAKRDIIFNMTNGENIISIKLPDSVKSIPITITVKAEEVVCG